MQIGFVNFNTEEKKRVSKMMQLLQESEAIEELGIGRVRDHFSNTLFPGTSTLQHHAKYFAILPSLYYQAAHQGKRFNSVQDVEKYIIEAEVQITRQLAEHEGQETMTGITGINTYKEAQKDYRKYVKYNPTYIYGSGMATYGMIPNTSIYQLILEISNREKENPHNKRWLKGEDVTDDAQNEMTGEKQLILCSGEKYDFFKGISMSMALSMIEADFVKKKILESPYCRDSLLSLLLEEDNIILPDHYYDLGQQLNGLHDEKIKDIYDKSVLFSKLVHLLDWSFNHAYYTSFDNDELAEDCRCAFEELYQTNRKDLNNSNSYLSLFDYIRDIDPLLTDFCENCYKTILEQGESSLHELDDLVTCREWTVKHERSKIGDNAYRDQKRMDPGCNTFRWGSVRTIVNELRNPQ